MPHGESRVRPPVVSSQWCASSSHPQYLPTWSQWSRSIASDPQRMPFVAHVFLGRIPSTYTATGGPEPSKLETTSSVAQATTAMLSCSGKEVPGEEAPAVGCPPHANVVAIVTLHVRAVCLDTALRAFVCSTTRANLSPPMPGNGKGPSPMPLLPCRGLREGQRHQAPACTSSRGRVFHCKSCCNNSHTVAKLACRGMQGIAFRVQTVCPLRCA